MRTHTPFEELLIVVAIIGIIAAIAIPTVLRYYLEKKLAAGPVACLQNMVQIVEGTDPADLECPVSEKRYTIQRNGDQDVLRCPDTEQHLSYSPRFVHEDGRWRFVAEMPASAVQLGQSVEFDDSSYAYFVENNAERILVRVQRRGRVRFVEAPVLLLLGVLGTLGLCFALIVTLKEVEREGLILTVVTVAAISGCIYLTYSIARVGANGLYSTKEETTISKSDGTVQRRVFAMGEPSEETETIENTKLFYPLSGRLLVIYEDGESLRYRFLSVGGSEVEEAIVGTLLAQGQIP